MINREGDSKNKSSEFFNLDNELSALVKKGIIPQIVADKLKIKLREKNVNLTREQLYTLVDKINEIAKNYKKTGQIPTKPNDTNMQKLVETVEKLEKRITDFETGKTSDARLVTTDDIDIPPQTWDINPLKNVPSDPESIIVLMKWLQHLIDKCGRDNLANILDYYVDIGWITQDVKISLIDYSHGITEDKKDINTKISDLPSKDHVQSFIYIQKLKGLQLDKHFIEKIDDELSRITKKLDKYQFK